MISLDSIIDPSDRPGLLRVFVDGDIYAFKASSVADGRLYTLGGLKEHSKAIFKYKADAETYCGKHGVEYRHIMPDFKPEPWKNCLASLKMLYRNIDMSVKYRCVETEWTSYLTGSLNFRENLLPHYKWNRLGVPEVIKRCDGDEEMARKILKMQPKTFEKNKHIPARKPFHLKAAKDWLRKNENGVSRDWVEADDLMGIAASQATEDGVAFVIVSIDKDLNCIPGAHLNTDRDEWYIISPEQALYNFYYQCLIGDGTDNIPGAGKGMGPKTAAKLLDGIENPSEQVFYDAVLATWLAKNKTVKEDEVADMLRRSAQCLWILTDHKAKGWREAQWKPPVPK